jgi:hypothetical protein
VTASIAWACAAVLLLIVAAWLAMSLLRWAKKGSRAGKMLAAAAFPFPDQPPPHEQVENARLGKPDAGKEKAGDR